MIPVRARGPIVSLGLLAFAALRPAPFYNSRMVSSAAFCQGECGSVCLTWTPISLAFLWKSPIVCSLEPSIIIRSALRHAVLIGCHGCLPCASWGKL